MSAAIAGIIGAIAGTILSGIVTYFLQRAADTRHWYREDQVRFQHEKLYLYRDFLNEVRFASGIRYCDDEMSRNLNSMVSEIGLVSSGCVQKVAEELVLATERWCEAGLGFFRGDVKEVDERKLAFERAEADFHKASRVELGFLIDSFRELYLSETGG